MRLPILVLPLAVAACSDGTAPGRITRTPPPASAYDLVFDGEEQDGRRVLFRARLDGAAPQSAERIGGGVEGLRPSPSPDGTRIAFHTLETYEAFARLFVLDVATGNAGAAGAPAPFEGAPGLSEREVTWAPDGRRIAFHSKRDDPLGGDILVADVDGHTLSALRNLTPRTPASPLIEPQYTPAWSPDGTRIAFTSYASGDPAIWVMDADGANKRRLTDPGHGHFIDVFPTWSPDGRSIAFQRVDAARAIVGVVPADGSGAPRFLPLPGSAYSPAWSPASDDIAIASDADGELDVYVVSPAGEVRRRIRRAGADRNPAWLRR